MRENESKNGRWNSDVKLPALPQPGTRLGQENLTSRLGKGRQLRTSFRQGLARRIYILGRSKEGCLRFGN